MSKSIVFYWYWNKLWKISVSGKHYWWPERWLFPQTEFNFLIWKYNKYLGHCAVLINSLIWITWCEVKMLLYCTPSWSTSAACIFSNTYVFVACFFCTPNYIVAEFLKRKRTWKTQTSQRQGQQLSWKWLLFLQCKLKHNYASDVSAIPLHYLCANIEAVSAGWR